MSSSHYPILQDTFIVWTFHTFTVWSMFQDFTHKYELASVCVAQFNINDSEQTGYNNKRLLSSGHKYEEKT